mgnify:FL=1
MTGQWAWHVHHRTLVERLNGPSGLAERQRYIQKEKPQREKARRLRLLKVVKYQDLMSQLAGYPGYHSGALSRAAETAIKKALKAALKVLHAQECPNCPWDGKTIFPRKPRKVKK